jgi:hypothetical protein
MALGGGGVEDDGATLEVPETYAAGGVLAAGWAGAAPGVEAAGFCRPSFWRMLLKILMADPF